MTFKVQLNIEPNGDKKRSFTIGDIEIINITRSTGRMSDDYLWRIRTPGDKNKIIDACGYIVDSYHTSSVDLLFEVLSEWKSGRELPIDNHGKQTLPEGIHLSAVDFWNYLDEKSRKS